MFMQLNKTNEVVGNSKQDKTFFHKRLNTAKINF